LTNGWGPKARQDCAARLSWLSCAGSASGREVRSLDAIHLATALHIDTEELVAYERRLLDAAQTRALRVASPGLQWRAAEPGR